MLQNINLQLFAEDTNPEIDEEMYLDNSKKDGKPVYKENPFDKLKKKFEKKELEKKDEKKPEENSEAKKLEKSDSEKPDAKKDPDTKEPEGKKEDEYDEIVHLGKKVKIPTSERISYLQMGYDYKHLKGENETLKGEHEKSKSILQRIANLEGFKTTEEYVAELDKREKTKLAEQIEEAAGDPKAIDEIMNNHPKVKKAEEKEKDLEVKERKQEHERKIEALKKEELFTELEPELKRLLNDAPSIDPNLAFSIVAGNYVRTGKLKELKQKTDEEVKKVKESTEKKVLADVHDKERRAAPTGGDTNEGTEVAQVTSSLNKIADVFGLNKAQKQKAAQRAHEKLKRS